DPDGGDQGRAAAAPRRFVHRLGHGGGGGGHARREGGRARQGVRREPRRGIAVIGRRGAAGDGRPAARRVSGITTRFRDGDVRWSAHRRTHWRTHRRTLRHGGGPRRVAGREPRRRIPR